jgi:hypothetical protein
MLALLAPESSLFGHLDYPSLNAKRQSFNQHPGDFASRRFDDSSKSLAGDSHALSRLFMVKPVEIRQPDRLIFVNGQNHLFQ